MIRVERNLSELIELVNRARPVELFRGRMFNLEGHWIQDFGYKATLTVIVSAEPPEEKQWEGWGKTPEEAVKELLITLYSYKG